jgi:3-oxoacyl-[acyl-carrier protein] reductase
VDLGLRDRVVLITGAGGGVGPTVARAFAAEDAAVALHHRGGHGGGRAAEAAAAISTAGGRAAAVEADLDSPDEVASLVETIGRELGPVAVLVTATSAYRSERFAEIEDESWTDVVDDILGATYRTCRAVVPGMQQAGWGRIVNIAARSRLAGVARSPTPRPRRPGSSG